MLFSAWVKYPKIWWASAGWSALGMVVVTGGWLAAARASARLRQWDLVGTHHHRHQQRHASATLAAISKEGADGAQLVEQVAAIAQRVHHCETELAYLRRKAQPARPRSRHQLVTAPPPPPVPDSAEGAAVSPAP
jgi:hypothetical protein